MTDRLKRLREELTAASRRVYGARLTSLAIFGSWARGAATPISDIDVLLVADPLPPSRRKRVAEFEAVEAATLDVRREIWVEHRTIPELSPVLKTPTDVQAGSPLFLDMTDRCDLLWDVDGFLAHYLEGLRSRMQALGAQRHPRKGGYYWQYKSDIRPHEVITL